MIDLTWNRIGGGMVSMIKGPKGTLVTREE